MKHIRKSRKIKKPFQLKIADLPLKNYVNRLAEKRYFSFVRYGDGEWKVLLKSSGRNGRAQEISPKLHQHMTESFLKCPREGIYFGMQNNILQAEKIRHQVLSYIKRHRIERRWINADVFHRASKAGKLFPLIKQMRKMKIVIIGPIFLRRLENKAFKFQGFIEVPMGNAYSAYGPIVDAIKVAYGKLGQDVIYSFSAGPSAEILIQDLFQQIRNSYLIDFGSLWDIFCGHRSRKYMSKEKYSNRKIHKNLGLRG